MTLNVIADVTNLDAVRDQAKEAVSEFERTLSNKDRTSRQLSSALTALRGARDSLGAHWPVLRGWILLLNHRGEVSAGEIYDIIMAAGLALPDRSPMDQLQFHFATIVWPDLSRFIGDQCWEGIEQQWFDAWLQLREQVEDDAHFVDRVDDCDALLELIARLFGMPAGDAEPASSAWLGSLHEQAAAYAQFERCIQDSRRPLVVPSEGPLKPTLAHQLVAALGAVYCAAMENPGLPGLEIATLLAAKPAFIRTQTGALQARDGMRQDGQRSAERRPEWIDLLLAFWAADDLTIAALLKKRGLIELNQRNNAAIRPLTWADGHEQRIALIGPSGAGKTSLMLSSDDQSEVSIEHALGGPSGDRAVSDLKKLWRAGKARNTAQEEFIARTEVRGLCSFSFIDVNGESYFPQEADKLQNLEVIRLRYARRPPAIVMLMLNGGRSTEMVAGKKLDDAIRVIRDSPVNTEHGAAVGVGRTDETVDHSSLNQSRPVYVLVSHVDELIANVIADIDEALAERKPDKRLIAKLEAALTADVLRWEDLNIDPRGNTASARRILMRSRELLASPAQLRVVLDALDVFFGPAQAFAAVGMDNLYLHFLRSGGGSPPQVKGVDALWRHLWDVTCPASRVARRVALERRLIACLEEELREVDGRVVNLEGIDLHRPDRNEFKANAAKLEAHAIKNLIVEKFRTPNLSLDMVLSDIGSSSVFSSRFSVAFDDLMGKYDVNLAKLDERVGAAANSILQLLGVPVDEDFSAFSTGRSLIANDESLKQLEGWRLQYLEAIPEPRPQVGVADADKLLCDLLRQVGNSKGTALLKRLLDEHRVATVKSNDAARTGSMFHALRGALNDTSMWRNLPLKSPDAPDDDWTVPEKWIQENQSLNMTKALIVEFDRSPGTGEGEDRDADWRQKVIPAISLLAGYRPTLTTLHANLLETDGAKIRSVDGALNQFDIKRLAAEALNDIRDLAVIVRGNPQLSVRLRSVAALAALEPLLESLNIDANELLHDAENVATLLASAQSDLDKVDAKWRSLGLFHFIKSDPGLLAGIKDSIAIVRSNLSPYGANGAQIIDDDAGATRDATLRAKRVVDFALWVARNIQQAPFYPRLGTPGEDLANIFGGEIEAVQGAIEKSKKSLTQFYGAVRNALLHERFLYLVEAGLLTGETAIAENLSAAFVSRDPGVELHVQPKEERYKQAVATLLSRLDEA